MFPAPCFDNAIPAFEIVRISSVPVIKGELLPGFLALYSEAGFLILNARIRVEISAAEQTSLSHQKLPPLDDIREFTLLFRQKKWKKYKRDSFGVMNGKEYL